MPVLLSGEGQTKLLGVAKLPTHADDTQGKLISHAVRSFLEDWAVDQAVSSLCRLTPPMQTQDISQQRVPSCRQI